MSAAQLVQSGWILARAGEWPQLSLMPMRTARKGSEASVLTIPLQGYERGCPTWPLTPAALTGAP